MASVNDDIISSFVDLSKTAKEKESFLKQLTEIYDLIKKVGSTKISLQGSNSLSDLVKINKELQGLLTKTTDALNKAADAEKAYADAQTKSSAATKKKKELTDEELKSQLEATEATRKRTAEIKNQIREESAAAGSIEKLRAQLIGLNKEYDNLSAAQRSSPQGQELLKNIQAVDAELKSLEFSTGRFQRNVGNYAGTFSEAFNILKSDLDEVKTKLSTINEGDAGFDDLNRKASLLEELLSGVSQQFSSTRAEERAFQEAATKLGVTLGLTNEQFLEFNKAVGASKNEIEDVKKATRFQASDTKGIDSLVASGQALAGVYGLAAGAQQLFGNNSEEVTQAIQKLAAVMTVLQSLQAIQNALQSESAVIQGALAIKTYAVNLAQKIYQATMLSSTAATVAFRISLIALTGGLFLLIPLLAGGAAALTSLNSETASTANNTELLNKKQELLSQIIKESASAYESAFEEVSKLRHEIELAKNGFLDKTTAVKEYNDTIGKATGEVKTLDEAEKGLNDHAADYIHWMLLKAKAHIAVQKAAEAAFNAETGITFGTNAQVTKDNILLASTTDPQAVKKLLDKRSQDIVQAGQEQKNALAKIAEDLATELQKEADDFANQKGFINAFTNVKSEVKKATNDIEADLKKLHDDLQSLGELPIIKQIDVLNDYKARLKAEQEAEKKSFDERVDAQQKFLNAHQSALYAAVDAEIAAENKLRDASIKAAEDAAKKAAEIKGRLDELKQQIAEQAFDLGINLVEATYEKQINAIQDQIDLLEQKRQKDIEVAQQTITNAQQQAAAIAVINARADAQRVLLEQKQRQEKLKEARADRDAQALKIFGEAIYQAAKYGFLNPISIAIEAIAALQIAALYAKPLPRYKHGIKDSPGTMAVVGDGGKQEVIQYPDGTTAITPASDTVTWLPQHSKVFPDVMDYLKNAWYVKMESMPAANNDIQDLVSRMDKRLLSVENTIRNKRESHFQVTPYGLMKMQQNMNQQISYMNDQTNW